ncbi:hypothetical protein RRG08_037242 [Elysia crispata]|uniref:Uncharacterized protein n=1 Tax=Elysia crispata TaxID=231223 RepID=A0AAE0YMC0_9GAST|nr:hypothetical protein RRG08_037242 [Elysia crispata]
MTTKKSFPQCRDVAKFLNCVQTHCFASLSPCEMNTARQWILSKFEATGIGCDSRKLLAPVGDCRTPSTSNERAQSPIRQDSATNAATMNDLKFHFINQNFIQAMAKYFSKTST